MQKIIPHLWFDKNAEEAVDFYVSVFGRSKKGSITRYTEAGFEVHHMPAGTVLTAEFEIEGYRFIALNGGPLFRFNPSISFTVNCPTVSEVDALWEKLSEGGKALMPLEAYPWSPRYGWVQDRFGISWQVIQRDVKEREIIPSLMYTAPVAGKAREAIELYASVFPDSKVGDISLYGPGNEAKEKEDSVSHGEFILCGQKFIAMDSSLPHGFGFNEAISLLVSCKDQAEVDSLWEKLNRDPGEGQCGWLHDKFGMSWQIAPEGMSDMFNSPDKAAADRAMNAMLSMKKIDIAAIHGAFEGR